MYHAAQSCLKNSWSCHARFIASMWKRLKRSAWSTRHSVVLQCPCVHPLRDSLLSPRACSQAPDHYVFLNHRNHWTPFNCIPSFISHAWFYRAYKWSLLIISTAVGRISEINLMKTISSASFRVGLLPPWSERTKAQGVVLLLFSFSFFFERK